MNTTYYHDRCKAEHKRKMTTEEENALVALAASGNRKAQDLLIYRYTFFVKGFTACYKRPGMDMEDLVSVGLQGVLKAIQTFEADRGVQFVSYAAWRVKEYIVTEINRFGSMIRLPANRCLQLRKNLRENPDSLAEDVKQLKTLSQGTESVHKLLGGDDSGELLGTLRDENAVDPSDMAADELRRFVSGIINSMQPSDKELLTKYYGLGGGACESLHSMARGSDKSFEALRSHKERAIGRIRRNHLGKEAKDIRFSVLGK